MNAIQNIQYILLFRTFCRPVSRDREGNVNRKYLATSVFFAPKVPIREEALAAGEVWLTVSEVVQHSLDSEDRARGRTMSATLVPSAKDFEGAVSAAPQRPDGRDCRGCNESGIRIE